MRISRKNILWFIVVIYPLIPYYFTLFGINATNIVVILISCVIFAIYKERILIFKKDRLFMIYLLACLCQTLSMVINGSMEALYYVLKIVLPFYYLTVLIQTKEDFYYVIENVVNASGVLCIFGIIEEVTHFNIFSLLNTSGSTLNYNALRFGLLRIISFTGQAITYGIYIMFCLCLCMYLLQVNNESKKKHKLIIIYTMLWINAIFTLSRSSILCCLLSQVLLLFFCGAKKTLKTISLVSLILIMIIGSACIFSDVARTAVMNFILMLAAVFDPTYSSLISASFGNDNLIAQGQRIDLYSWVIESMNGKWLFGNGYDVQFSYSQDVVTDGWTWTSTKTSIEVQSLFLLFHYGVITVAAHYIAYILTLLNSWKNRKIRLNEEKALGFNGVMCSIIVTYLFYFLANSIGSEEFLFYILIALFIAYNRLTKVINQEGL